jgi:hypothetical protein
LDLSPGRPAVPSQRDQDAVAQIAQDADFKAPEPVIGILATPWLPHRASATVAFFDGDAAGTLKPLDFRIFDRLPDAALPRNPGRPGRRGGPGARLRSGPAI